MKTMISFTKATLPELTKRGTRQSSLTVIAILNQVIPRLKNFVPQLSKIHYWTEWSMGTHPKWRVLRCTMESVPSGTSWSSIVAFFIWIFLFGCISYRATRLSLYINIYMYEQIRVFLNNNFFIIKFCLIEIEMRAKRDIR